jgi:hypothetical protein
MKGAKLTCEHIAAAVMDAADPEGEQLQLIFPYVYGRKACDVLRADAPA